MKQPDRSLLLLVGLFVLVVPLAFSTGDDDKPKEEDKKDKQSSGKSGQADAKKDDAGKDDASKEKPEVERGTQGNPVKSGLRKRRGYKQRMTEAMLQAEEERKRSYEKWLAGENRRRDAIRRVREERAAQRKKRQEEEGEKGPPDDLLLPPEKLATITMKNGCSFKGVIMTETEQEITVKIKGGEMTIDKRMISAIARPPERGKKKGTSTRKSK